MKKIIPIVILIFYSFNLYSQVGIKGGINYSTITSHSLSKYKFSGHIGGTYDIKFSERWYVQSELLFTSIGCNLKEDGSVVKDGHINIYALEMPISISFRPEISNNLNLLVDLGMYLQYGLFGNKTYNYYNSPKIDKSPFDAYNRFNTGLNFGLGLQRKNYYGIFTFQRGVTHAEKDIDGSHQVIRFSLGYRF